MKIPPTDYARLLRKNATACEKELWQYLRYKQIDGYRFNRQFKFAYQNGQNKTAYFYFDFYCHAAKIAIEVDGSSHIGNEVYDAWRDATVASFGIYTLRISNNQIVENIDAVLSQIKQELKKRVFD
jgi:very-short-patch-repair endonuclease